MVLNLVSVKGLGYLTLSLPLFATVFCVFWSLVFHFKASTWTHCKEPEILPSISSAIGGFAPQKYVWRICIAIHSFPRLLFALIYFKFYSQLQVDDAIHRTYTRVNLFVFLLNIVENFSLVVLSYVSSTENYQIHEKGFIVFLVTSFLHMVLTCALFRWNRQYGGRTMTAKELRSWKLKLYSFVFNCACALISVYLFLRHDWYCEAYSYTRYVFFEYMVVFSNIFFHGTAVIDFSDYSFSVSLTEFLTSSNTKHVKKKKH